MIYKNKEEYSGIIMAIDCRDKIEPQIPEQTEPKEGHYQCRIKIRYNGSKTEGHELVNFDLPDSYIGRHIQVRNNNWFSNNLRVSQQEIISFGGLEKLSIQIIDEL